MTIKIENNPFKVLFDIYKKLNKDNTRNIVVRFVACLYKDTGNVGETFIPDNKNEAIIISIDAEEIPFVGIVEVLAHELAHVIVGIENGHNEIWNKTLDIINEEYNKIMLKTIGEENTELIKANKGKINEK